MGFAISSLLGGVIGHYISLRAAYFLSIPAAMAAVVVLLGFREPQLHRKVESQLVGKQFTQTVRTIMRKGIVTKVVLCLVLATVCSFIMNQLDQIWMLALALPILMYGPVNAILLASTAASGILANRVATSRSGPAIVVGTVFVASSLLLIRALPLVITGQVLFLGSITVLQIVLSRDLHAVAASNIRSGVSSLVTTIGTALFLPIALLFGYISDRYNVFHAAWIVFSLVILLCLATVFTIYSQPRSILTDATP